MVIFAGGWGYFVRTLRLKHGAGLLICNNLLDTSVHDKIYGVVVSHFIVLDSIFKFFKGIQKNGR